MVEQLYVTRGNSRFGPFSAAQLRKLAVAGRLQLTDTLWKEGMDRPVLAAKVKNLFPASPSPATPADAGAPAGDGAPTPAPGPGTPAEQRPEGILAETVAAQAPSPPLLATTDIPSPSSAAANENSPAPQPEQPRKRRAVGLRGAVIVSQDGYTVQYRKKCSQCGCEDACRSTMPIATGTTRTHFFCPKCRKSRDVQIQGIVQ
jgi:hypothetical protein